MSYEDRIRNPHLYTSSNNNSYENRVSHPEKLQSLDNSLERQIRSNGQFIDFEYVINHPECENMLLVKYETNYSFTRRVNEKMKNDKVFREKVKQYLPTIHKEYIYLNEEETTNKKRR